MALGRERERLLEEKCADLLNQLREAKGAPPLSQADDGIVKIIGAPVSSGLPEPVTGATAAAGVCASQESNSNNTVSGSMLLTPEKTVVPPSETMKEQSTGLKKDKIKVQLGAVDLGGLVGLPGGFVVVNQELSPPIDNKTQVRDENARAVLERKISSLTQVLTSLFH